MTIQCLRCAVRPQLARPARLRQCQTRPLDMRQCCPRTGYSLQAIKAWGPIAPTAVVSGGAALRLAPIRLEEMLRMANSTKRWLTIAAIVILAGVGYYAWQIFASPGLPEGIASGNGRIEATEIDIAAKIPGRIRDILVREGDFVAAGQVLVHMNTDQLEARRRQAQAELQRALIGVDTAKSLVTQRDAERKAATAVIAQREAEFDAATRRLERSQQLVKTNTVSQQVLDDDRANAQGASAAVNVAKAQLAAADAAVSAAKAQIVDAEAAVDAARAAIETITADINDSTLTSPRD